MRPLLMVLSACASLGLVVTACTVTTEPIPDDEDAGTTRDGGADTATSDGGTTDAPSGDGATCALKISTVQGASCDKCLETSCCAESNACLTSDDCIALVGCVAACDAKDAATSGDGGSEQTACLNDCSNKHPSSVNAYVDYSVCVEPACQTGAEAPCR